MQRDVNEKVGENRPSFCRDFFFFESFFGSILMEKSKKYWRDFFFNREESHNQVLYLENFHQMGSL